MPLLRGEPIVLELPDGEMVEGLKILVHQTDVTDQSVLDVQTKFINQARYKGDSSTLRASWPKEWSDSLIGCHVWLRGERYRVYGDPFPLDKQVTPTEYNRVVVLTKTLYLYKINLLTERVTKDEWGVAHIEWDSKEVNANLLRLADESQSSNAGQRRPMQPITLFELRPEDYNDELAYEYAGEHYTVTSRAFAEDTVVITGEGNVAHD